MLQIADHKLLQAVIAVGAAIVLQFIGHHAIGFLVRRGTKKSSRETQLDIDKRQQTIITILRTTYAALIWIILVCSVLTIFGVNVAALLTGAGIIGVFAALSAQNTVKDFLAGTFILFEHQYRVGDIVSLMGGTTGATGATGTVEEITLRITKLRDNSGRLITVRNGEPIVIINQTYSDASIILDLNFTYDSDIAAVQKLINEVGDSLMKDKVWHDLFTSPIKYLRIDNFTETGVVVRATGKVAPASQWDVAGEYRERLLRAVAKQTKVKLGYDASKRPLAA